jgi:DNA-binding response OmpR family regulator
VANDRYRVLVVEDDPDVRRLICRILELHEYTTSEAVNGVRAFEQLRVAPPDVVVLDLMMPAVNGFEVAEGMRADPTWRAIPIIAMTATIHLEAAVAAMRPLFVLRKPFSMDELLDRVAAALRMNRRTH